MTAERNHTTTTRTIGGKEYAVKSVYLGNTDKNIKALLLNIAERRAMSEMGYEMDYLNSPQKCISQLNSSLEHV